MNISRRSLLSIAGAGALTIGLSSCTSSSNNATDGQSGGSGGADAFSYSLPDRFQAWLTDLKWFPVLQQNTGVTVNLVDGGPGDKYAQQLDLNLTNGKISDVVVATAAQAQVYGPQGAFADLAPVIKEHGPNIQKYIDGDDEFKSLITSEGGAIYGLVSEYPKISTVTFYRQDQATAAGVSAAPTTVAEFTDMLTKLKTTFGPKDSSYFPLTGRDDLLTFMYAFGASDGIDSSGKVHGIYKAGQGMDIKSSGFADMVNWYRTLYTQGLIDPEYVSGTNTEETWQTKLLTGKGSASKDFFTRPSWFMTNGGPQNDPNYMMAVAPAFKSASGEQLKQAANPRFDMTRFLSVSASSNKAEAFVKFMDHLYTDKGQTTMHYGVEGESYKLNGGKPEYTVSFDKEANAPAGTKVWNFLQDRLTFPAPVDNEAYYAWVDDFTKKFAGDYFSQYIVSNPVLKYSPEQLQQRTDLLAAVEPFVVAEVVKVVTGDRPASDLSSIVSEADAKGYSKITQIDQAAYDAMKG